MNFYSNAGEIIAKGTKRIIQRICRSDPAGSVRLHDLGWEGRSDPCRHGIKIQSFQARISRRRQIDSVRRAVRFDRVDCCDPNRTAGKFRRRTLRQDYEPAFALVEAGGKRAIVKINDVGPLMRGRIIDFNEQTMRYFDPTLQRGLVTSVKITPLYGRGWTAGPLDG